MTDNSGVPSTPIISSREALIGALARHRFGDHVDFYRQENQTPWKSLVGDIDALLASGLVKDTGDTPVDRLAVIREVIDWYSTYVSPTNSLFARQHFGVAPVEEEA